MTPHFAQSFGEYRESEEEIFYVTLSRALLL